MRDGERGRDRGRRESDETALKEYGGSERREQEPPADAMEERNG